MAEPKESRETRTREKITLDTEVPPMPSKAERIPAPDEDKYQRELKSLEAKIARLRESKRGVHDQIKEKKEGGKMDNQELSAQKFIGSKLLSRKEHLNNRAKLREELDILKHEFYEMIDEQKRIKPRIKIFNKDEVEKQIELIQHKIETTTLSLSEEKKLISELSFLQQSVPLLVQYLTRSKKIEENKAKQEVLKAQINAINQEIDQTSSLIQETSSKMKSSKDQLKEELPKMFEETKKIQEEIDKLENDKKVLFEDFKEKKFLYSKQQNLIKQIEFITKMKAKLVEQEERRKAEEEYEKLREQNKPHPYAKEITSCITYIAYLNKFIPKETLETQQKENKVDSDQYLPDKAALNAKETEEWFGATGKKQKKKKNKKVNKTEGLLTSHPIDLLNFFSYIGVKVPTNVDEAKEAIHELENKQKHWEGLDTRESEEESKKSAENKNLEKKLNDLSFNPVDFPAPEESKDPEKYGIFKDEGPVPVQKEEVRGKRGKRRFK